MTHQRPDPSKPAYRQTLQAMQQAGKLNNAEEQARKDAETRAFKAGKGSYRYVPGQGFVFVPKEK